MQIRNHNRNFMLFLPTNDSFEVLNVDTREEVEHFEVVASDESLPHLDEVLACEFKIRM